MPAIENGRPVYFITHRRISEGYEKAKITTDYGHTYTNIQKIGVDNNTEQ